MVRVMVKKKALKKIIRAQHADMAGSVDTTNALMRENEQFAAALRECERSAWAALDAKTDTAHVAGLRDCLKASRYALKNNDDYWRALSDESRGIREEK